MKLVLKGVISRHVTFAIVMSVLATIATAGAAMKEPAAQTVRASATPTSSEFAARVEALRAARLAGDQDRVRSLCAELERFRPAERIRREPGASDKTWVVHRTERAGRGDPLGDDVRVNQPQWTTSSPAMASTGDGVLFLVAEDVGPGQNYLDIYYSTNDGYTWIYLYSLYGLADLTNPSIAIGEGNKNRVLIAYEYGRDTVDAAILVFWVDLDTWVQGTVTVEDYPYWIEDPQICVDSPYYTNWWPYLTYTKGGLTRQDYHDLLFCRSFDYGESWETPSMLATDVASDCRPDIDFGYPNLYVAYTRYEDGYENDVYVLRSTSLGSSWDAELQLIHDFRDETDPRVVATNGGGAVVVAFTREYSPSNTDIESFVSQDSGDSWTLSYLPWTDYLEAKVDLEVSPDLDRIHAAFWSEHDIHYTWSTWEDPGTWAPVEVINHGSTAAVGVRPTITVNPSKEQEACCAWTDTRIELQYHVYFNATYPLGDYQIILADASLAPAVEPLVLWKQALGYNVYVVDCPAIYEAFPGIDDAEKIWNCLHEFRDQLRYVLLVGDIDLLPMRMLYPDGDPAYPPSDPRHHNGYAYGSDYYYAEHTMTDWDLDNDNRWGEFTDDAFDYTPDLLVGRIPFNEAAPVQAVCSNIVSFEQDTGAWKRNMLLAHGFLSQPSDPTRPGADCAAMADYTRLTLIEPYEWSSTTLFERGGLGWSSYGCTAALSQANYESYCGPQSFGIVNCAAHGNGQGFAGVRWLYDLNGTGYCDLDEEWCYNSYSERGQIPTHPAQSFVFLNGCSSAPIIGDDPAFNASPLRSLYLIRTPRNDVAFKDYLLYGAPGLIGSSAGSADAPVWDSPDDGGSSSLAYYFYVNLIAGNMPVGAAFDRANYTFAMIHGLKRPTRVFDYYGDPSLSLQGIPAAKAGGVGTAGRVIPGHLNPDEALQVALDWRRSVASGPDREAGSSSVGSASRTEAAVWTSCAELAGATSVTSLVQLPGGAVMGTGTARYDTTGTQGLIFASPDGWDPWIVWEVPGMHSARTIYRTNAGTVLVGVLAGALPDEPIGLILRSTDGGENWSICHEIGGGMVTGICQDAAGKLWACCGLNGQIHSSVDDGATWSVEFAFTGEPHLTSIMQASSGRYFITAALGAFPCIFWSDDGTSWFGAGGLSISASAYGIIESDGHLYAGVEESGARVYRSDDLSGEFWSPTPGFPTIEGSIAVESVAVDADGRVYAGVAMEQTDNSTSVYAMDPDEGVWRQHGGTVDLADRVNSILPLSGVVYIGTGSFNGNIYRSEGPVLTGVPGDGEPEHYEFGLDQNTPNPFNPRTTIAYELAHAARVQLRVYDVSGRLVRVLRDGDVEDAGRHHVDWDGCDDRGLRVASGVYVYRIEAGDLVATRRMVLLK